MENYTLHLVEQGPDHSDEAEYVAERDTLFREVIKIPEVAEALTLLDTLPEHLEYHTKEHTLDVIRETILFGLADGLPREVIERQAIGAAWHDVGFITQDANNEGIAIELFQKSSAFSNLPEEISQEIIANIRDTALNFTEGVPKQDMKSSVLGYMLDADLSNFGRDDFFECMGRIARETGKDLSDAQNRRSMYQFAISLLENHQWHTNGAFRLREVKKQQNLALLKSEYTELMRVAA